VKGRTAAAVLVSTALLLAWMPVSRADTGLPPALVRTIGGPGHAAMYPSGVEVDVADGAYVVADTGNNRIERYSAAGTLLWSVGGFGTSTSPVRFNNPRDVGVDAAGDIFVADTGNVRIVKLDGATGAFVSTWKGVSPDKISSPIGISVSLFDDQVYVADAGAKKVRIYDTSGTHIRSFGESGTCVFSSIRDVDAGPNGNVYIANYLKNNVLRMSSTGSCLASWGSKGTGDGQFKNPYGVRVVSDPEAGTAVFVADSNNNRVQEFTPNGTFLAKLGTTGTAADRFGGLRRVAVGPAFACPLGQCISVAGADLWGWKLGVWTGNGVDGYAFTTTVTSPVLPPPGDGGTTLADPPTSVFNEVRQVAFAADGSLRVMDSVNQRIVWLDPDGTLGSGAWDTCGRRGWVAGAFNWPRGIAIDQATGDLWVADTKQSRLQVIEADCTKPMFIGKAGSGLANFNWPYSIAIDQTTRVAYVADRKNHRILAYDVATRTPIAAFGVRGSSTGQFNLPSGIAVDPAGHHVFVADANNKRIVELAFNGSTFSWVGAFTGTGTPSLKKPEGVAVDATSLYVADTLNNRLVVIRRSDGVSVGTITGMLTPQSVSVAGTCVYVSDTYHDVIGVYSYGGCP
jgi:sugar lactone lactonase YvrE